jgi:transcriptional regulator with XRE-family HTH domain
MEIMDTARLNIKKQREIKGLRQQDLADKMSMSLRSYQSLENGETKLDLERLEQIAKILETSMEELLQQEGVVIHQEINEASGTGSGTGIFNNYGIEKEVVDMIVEAKDSEINSLKEEIKSLQEEIKYFRERLDLFLKNK